MTNNINILSKNLYDEIYSNTDLNNINYQNLEKSIFSLLKQSLIEQKYEIEIGSYKINFNPQKILVSYETLSSYIEISNKDIHEESEIVDNIIYYTINTENNEQPIIKTNTSIIKYDNLYKENIYIELINYTNNNINEYFKKSNEIEIINDTTALISKYIDIKNKRIDIKDYMTENLLPIKYDSTTKTYNELTNFPERKTYQKLIPNTEYQNEIVKFIYNSIVKFYSQYI